MTTQQRPSSHFVSDFPGVFAAKVAAVLAAVFWPWFTFHGVARVAAGIPWTGCALVIAFLIARKRLS